MLTTVVQKKKQPARSTLLHVARYQQDNSFPFHLHAFFFFFLREFKGVFFFYFIFYSAFPYVKACLQSFLPITLKETSFLQRLFLLISQGVYSVLRPKLSGVIDQFYTEWKNRYWILSFFLGCSKITDTTRSRYSTISHIRYLLMENMATYFRCSILLNAHIIRSYPFHTTIFMKKNLWKCLKRTF